MRVRLKAGTGFSHFLPALTGREKLYSMGRSWAFGPSAAKVAQSRRYSDGSDASSLTTISAMRGSAATGRTTSSASVERLYTMRATETRASGAAPRGPRGRPPWLRRCAGGSPPGTSMLPAAPPPRDSG